MTTPYEDRFWSKVDRKGPEECWEWLAAKVNGYGRYQKGNHRNELATHTSMRIAGKPRPGALNALHRCDNPGCVNPDHIFWGTITDNNRDMFNKGRDNTGAKGELNYYAKITEDDVRDIRKDTRSQREIAASYGLTQAAISPIVRRKNWKHVL